MPTLPGAIQLCVPSLDFMLSTRYSLVTMASLHCSARSPQAIPGFHRPSFNTNTVIFFNPAPTAAFTHFSFRFKNATRLHGREKLGPVFASNNNPSEGSDIAKTSDAKGPPFLTILAGFFIFFLICWIIGTIVTWLIGLIVNPPSK